MAWGAITSMKETFLFLMSTHLSAYQVERECKERGVRLSVMGWSEYAVENGVLKLRHNYCGEEYTEEVSSVEELNFFDEGNVRDFEYPQDITAEMVKALRKIRHKESLR